MYGKFAKPHRGLVVTHTYWKKKITNRLRSVQCYTIHFMKIFRLQEDDIALLVDSAFNHRQMLTNTRWEISKKDCKVLWGLLLAVINNNASYLDQTATLRNRNQGQRVNRMANKAQLVADYLRSNRCY